LNENLFFLQRTQPNYCTNIPQALSKNFFPRVEMKNKIFFEALNNQREGKKENKGFRITKPGNGGMVVLECK